MLLDELLTSSASRRPLRVALIVQDGALPRPLAFVVERLQRSQFAQVELVVDERPRAAPALGIARRLGSAAERSRRCGGAAGAGTRSRGVS